jgi:hypothetical protein
MASVQLAGLVPITDVSRCLGHKDTRTAHEVCGHLVPGGAERARDVSDAAWAKFTSMPAACPVAAGDSQEPGPPLMEGRALSCRLRAVRAVYDAATPSREDSRAGMPPDLWASRRA